MPRVFIPPPLRELTLGQVEVELEATNVRQLIGKLEQRFPGIAARLKDGDTLAPGIAVILDGVTTPRSLLTEIAPDSEVHFLPAVAGG